MSMHKIPLTYLEREGLNRHKLVVDAPCQLSDAFRLGMKWAQDNASADGWISVEDELPSQDGFVLARSIGVTDSAHCTGTLILYFRKNHQKGQQFHSASRITPVTCTHWMPLPKAASCGE